MNDFEGYWYFHLDRPENGPRPLYDALSTIWYKAEHWDHLIIFEASVDAINRAERESHDARAQPCDAKS